MATLRIGIIGAGTNTRARHIPGFQQIEGVEVVALCNRTRESGERVAAAQHIPRVADSPEAIIADPAIDAICIGTWPYKHQEYTVAALAAGKHVLCEARMASTAAEAEAMLAASRAHPRRVAQVVPAPFDYRMGPTIRAMVRNGDIGEIREVVVTAMNGSALEADTPLHWRQRADYSGRNVMLLGIFNEVVQRWLGDTTRVLAHARIFTTHRRDPETEREHAIAIPDSLGVFADMANGARATYLMSNVADLPPYEGIVIYGAKGSIRWSPDDTAAIVRRSGQVEPIFPAPEAVGRWRVEADFVDSIREGKPVTLTSFEDGVRYMRFTDAVWQSWQAGRPVDIAPLP